MSDQSLMSIVDAERLFGGGRTLFGKHLPVVHALQDVSIEVARGETVGIVGESGCGKSTLARLLVGLDTPTNGSITFDGEDLVALAKADRRALARRIQYVFQDPLSSLNPRKTIRTILSTPLVYLHGMDPAQRNKRLEELMEAVRLAPEFLDRYPHEFSGGQAQRIGIARALAADPELIVLDEPVSALDVSVQAQVLNILDDLKQRLGLTYLFISHDLSVVESVSDRVAILYFGRLAEVGEAKPVFRQPRHPYTRLLLQSAPTPGRKTLVAEDANTELPDPFHPPAGCAFYARCPNRSDQCADTRPALRGASPESSHVAACFHPVDAENPGNE